MSKFNYNLVIKYKNRSWNKTLQGDDWEKHYSDITKFVKKRTNKQIDTKWYATIENATVSSKDVFESLVVKSDQSVATEFIVHDGPPPANKASDDNKDTSQEKYVIKNILSAHADDDSKDNKEEAKGIILKVNLNDMDCKTNEVTINNVDDDSWQKLLKEVGEACEDSQWSSKYSLCKTNNTNEIERFVETSQDFIRFLQKNGGKQATLFARGVTTAVKDKTFLIEYNGKTVLWQPSGQFARNTARAWSQFLGVLKQGFGSVDLKVLHIYYNKQKNRLAMNTNELNSESIEQFWKKLKDDKRAAIMYFEICENVTEMDEDEKVRENYKGINVNGDDEYYFVVKHDGNTLNWSPNTLTNINWSQQYDKLKNDVCRYFGLQVCAAMEFMFGDMEIKNSQDIENIWEEEVKSSNIKSVKLTVLNTIQANGVDKNVEIILRELSAVDKNLKNIAVTNNIECDLEFVYDNIQKRQALVESCKSCANSKMEEVSFEPEKEVTDAVLNRFKVLINSMRNEGFSDTNVTIISLCKARDGIRKRDWDVACHELKTVLDEVRPFNIKEMLKLHGLANKAAEQVIGKDIVLLLGNTGAGKHTTLHFLGGSTMKRDPNSGHIEPVPMKLSQAGVPLIGNNKRDLVLLCDTPSFDDSASPEVDVANGLGIFKGVSQANSVKVILVISISDFEMHMKGIKNLAHTLIKIMPKFDQYFDCITPIYTKMNKTATEMKNILNEAMIDMKKKGKDNDETFNIMLQLLSRIENPIILNPIKSNRKKVLKQTFDQENSDWISEPSEQFEPFVTEGSRNLMKQQILKYKENIVKAVKHSNYSIIQRKLSELVELNAVIPDKVTEISIVECMKQVSKNWNEKCIETIRTLRSSAKSLSLEEFIRDTKKYQTLLDEAKECEMFVETFRSARVPDSQFENQDLVSGMIDTRQINHHLNKVFEILVNECSLEPQTKIYYHKAQAICNQFGSDFCKKYQDRMNALYDEVLQITQQAEKCIVNNCDYDKLYANLNKLGTLGELQAEFAFGNETKNAFDILQISTSLEKQLIESLQNMERVLDEALVGLPDKIRNQLDVEFKIDTTERKELETLISLMDRNEYDHLNNVYWNYQNNNNTIKANKIKDMVHQKLEQMYRRVVNSALQENMKSQDSDGVMEALETACKIVTQFGPNPNSNKSNKSNKIPEFVELFSEIVKVVVEKYDSCVDEIEALKMFMD